MFRYVLKLPFCVGRKFSRFKPDTEIQHVAVGAAPEWDGIQLSHSGRTRHVIAV